MAEKFSFYSQIIRIYNNKNNNGHYAKISLYRVVSLFWILDELTKLGDNYLKYSVILLGID